MQHPSDQTSQTQNPAPLAGERTFQVPSVWMDPRELSEEYWKDEKLMAKHQQEFFDKPIDTLDWLEKLPTFESTRRTFLKTMGAGMALTAMACSRPRSKIVPFVDSPVETRPGVPSYYASTCGECSTGCGVLVKTRENRPILVEGNPDAPNNGKICVKGSASVLNLYDPDRLRAPVVDGEKLTWNPDSDHGLQRKALYEVVDKKVGEVLSQAKRVRVLSNVKTGPSYHRLVKEFLSAFPSGKHIMWESGSNSDIAEAQDQSYGQALLPHYRFAEADVVVSLGADFLGDWIDPVEAAQGWSQNRNLRGKKAAQARLSKVVVFESNFSMTGASADDRFPVAAGDELKIALGLANEIILQKRISNYGSDSGLRNLLKAYTLKKVAADTGVKLADLNKVAQHLAENRGKSLVVAGSLHARTSHAVALQTVTNLLNSALDNEGATVDGSAQFQEHFASWKDLVELIDELKAGKVDVLVIHGANPLYSLSKTFGFEEALKRVSLLVTFSDSYNETAQAAHVAIPDAHYLENWGDSEYQKGTLTLQQPTVAPLYGSRSFEESLLAWVRGAGLRAVGLAKRIANTANLENPWHEYLMAHWKEKFASGGNFELFWQNSLRKGVHRSGARSRSKRSMRLAAVIKNVPSDLPKSSESQLVLYAKNHMGDGRSANNAWLQEIPAATSSVTWGNYLNIAPSRARQEKLVQNDVVTLTVGDQELDVPVNVQPGMHPLTFSLAVGYGRSASGAVGTGVGVNAFPFVSLTKEGQPIFAGMKASIKKTGRKYELARTQEHHRTLARPITNDITLDMYRQNPRSENHVDPHLRLPESIATRDLWRTQHEETYKKGYRWGMAVDLNACTGCNSCVVACQAENNIPTVGREQVLVSREMHWLRIDRYYSGDEDNPQAAYHPLMCQHCENASCETVCPVLATVHTDEGLNDMTYNRCVGTRYCQNNCPYKVRRFNFFDNWLKAENTAVDLVWNPDVTLRSRGIMEKCTFCTQRINSAKIDATVEGRTVRDGEIKTACQSACPTGAITFGNINDTKSEVSQWGREDRAFSMLQILNNKPQVAYLSKVRNTEVAFAHAGAHGDSHAKGHKEGDGHEHN